MFTTTRHSKEFFPLADKPQLTNYISLCWGSALSARDLMCGVKPSSRYNKTSAEFCCPQILARQFGLLHNISLAYQSMVTTSGRPTFSDKNVESLVQENIQKLNSFEFRIFRQLLGESSTFINWWPTVVNKIFSAPTSNYLTILIVRGMDQPALNSQPISATKPKVTRSKVVAAAAGTLQTI